jgi:uncharacterized protein YacL (UPF0231 family)
MKEEWEKWKIEGAQYHWFSIKVKNKIFLIKTNQLGVSTEEIRRMNKEYRNYKNKEIMKVCGKYDYIELTIKAERFRKKRKEV